MDLAQQPGQFTIGGSTVLTVAMPQIAADAVAARRPSPSVAAPEANTLPAQPQDAPTPGCPHHHPVPEVFAHVGAARDAVTGRGYIEDVLWLIGRGPGETQNGDDALVGIPAALISNGQLDQGVAAKLARTLERDGSSLTTYVYLAYLACALRGEFGRAVTDVIDALGDQDRVQPAMRRLAQRGHTSDVYLLLGISVGLEPVTSGKDA